jgi:DNA-binding beta-propeller fold protein YncE
MFLRRALVTLALLAGATAAHAAPLAIVVDSAGAALSVVDMDRRVEIRRIPVLREPHHVALTPDHRTLLVGDAGGNEMLFLDPATGDIRRRIPLADPYQLGFSPDGRFLTVNGLARNQVDVYDAATMKLLKRFPIASMPSHLDYAPDSGVVYVSLQGTGEVAAFDLKRFTVLWTAQVGPAPAGVLVQNGKLLVAIMGSDYVAVLDPADGHTERHIHAGRGAHQLFRSPDGKIIYVNSRVDGTTIALDAATLQFQRSYKIPGGPDCIAFAPDGDLWITQRWAEKVAVLDPKTGNFRSIDVGRSPHGIFLTTELHE